MDLRRMLKVYNYVNDERRVKVSVKFLGLVAALLAVGGLLVLAAVTLPGGPADGPPTAAEPRTEHVGLTPLEVALYGSDAALIDQRMAAWQAAHPEAEVLSIQRAYDTQNRWTGYHVTYVP